MEAGGWFWRGGWYLSSRIGGRAGTQSGVAGVGVADDRHEASRTMVKSVIWAVVAWATVAATAWGQSFISLPAISGPVQAGETYTSISLPQGQIPPGTYTRFRVIFDWADAGTQSFSVEARVAFTSESQDSVFPPISQGTVYVESDAEPFGGQFTSSSVQNLLIDGTFSTPYTGGPLFLSIRQDFFNTAANWGNIRVQLGTGTVEPGAGSSCALAVTIDPTVLQAPPISTAALNPNGTVVLPCATSRYQAWWKFRPATPGRYLFSTLAGDASEPGNVNDTVLAVFRGSCSSLEAVACNDNAAFTTRSRAVANLNANQDYWIVVGRADDGTTIGTDEVVQQVGVTLLPPAAPPVNTTCATAVTFSNQSRFPLRTVPAEVGAGLPGTGVDLAPCLAGVPNRYAVWYRIPTCNGGLFTFSTGPDLAPANTVRDTVMGVYRVNIATGLPECQSLQLIGCNDDVGIAPDPRLWSTVTVNVPPDSVVYVVVARKGTDAAVPGEFVQLGITSDTQPCVVDFNGDCFRNTDDLTDFITLFFIDPPASGPGGFATPGGCPGAPFPYDFLGYLLDFNRDCALNIDDLSDFITAYFLNPPGCR